MARYCGSICRLCRREGEKLFLKGERCYTSKCAVERREGGPGQHGKGRQSFSNFKQQLREKQKLKRIFGLLEKPMHNYAERALSTKGVTGTELLQNLERRLDNIVYRLGFGFSRRQARQLVTHGHVIVNNKTINIPSFPVSVSDVIEIKEKTKKNIYVTSAMEAASSRFLPEWLSLDKAAVKGELKALPSRDQMSQNIRESLIVEHYAR